MNKTYQIKCGDKMYSVVSYDPMFAVGELAGELLEEPGVILQDKVEMFCEGRKYLVEFQDGQLDAVWNLGFIN